MRRYSILMRRDLRDAVRDPMLLLILMGPLLLTALMRWGWPPASSWITSRTGIDVLAYTEECFIFLITLIPLLVSVAAGLMMLDERDERMIDYYMVTPLRKHGYLIYRLTLPVIIACAMTWQFAAFSGLTGLSGEQVIPIVLLALEAPLFALALVTFAADKVEGLALSKLITLTLLGPVVASFSPSTWQWLAWPLPTYWPARLYLDLTEAGSDWLRMLTIFGTGLVLHGLFIVFLWRRFSARLE
ncbi:hypothetical protein [Paenibacillus sp. 1P07SE]|uniref:hypothetical protein n=1 Tax=Paenibacillus sp. 1P07SE TaxID=3132209 RepID=UPI0039A67335